MIGYLPRLSELPPSVWAVAIALLLLALMLLLRRVWMRLLGPVFEWESERLARRKSTFVMRVIFVSAVLAALYSAWPHGEYLNFSDRRPLLQLEAGGEDVSLFVMRRFSLEFSNAFLIAQSSVLLLLTPMYIAGAITEEKEKKSLDFLLVTRMRDRDIILGKFGSRILTLLMVELSALPVLAVTLLFGGVDLPRLFAGLAATALTVLSVGSFSLLCSVCFRRTWVAIAVSYVASIIASGICLLVYGSLSSPFAFYENLDELLRKVTNEAEIIPTIIGQLLEYSALHLGLTFGCLLVATLVLRFLAEGLVGALGRRVGRRGAVAEGEKVKPRRVYRTRAKIPRVANMPVVWKERYLGRTIVGSTLHLVAWLAFLVLALIVTAFAVVFGTNYEDAMATMLRGLVLVAATLLMFGMGLRLAGVISREREQRTLESLMTIPSGRGSILQAKWIGAWLSMRRYVLGFLFAVALAVYKGEASWWLSLALILIVAVHATFAANLGLCLSAICRTTARAYVSVFLVLLILAVGSWALFRNSEEDRTSQYARAPTPWFEPPQEVPDFDQQMAFRGLNPVLTWSMLLSQIPKNEPQEMTRNALTYVFALVNYSVAAGLLWLFTLWRFRREAVRG